MKKASELGFTLIELTIVFVVIGLLVGGILGGQELVYQSQLRKAATKITTYKTAIKTFQGKYGELPGDFSRAKTYFSDCIEASGYYACNGNGNGILDETEPYYVWRHLSLAKMIQEQFNEQFYWDRTTGMATLTLPKTLEYVLLFNDPIPEEDSEDYYGLYGNNLLGMRWINGRGVTFFSDCNSIGDFDSKIDDGRYDQGVMRPRSPSGCADTTSTDGMYLRDISRATTLALDLGLVE
jgi:hypothetical protein